MMMRAEEDEEGGGLMGLHREAIKLFLAAFVDSSTNANLKDFIIRSMRHHILNAQNPDVLLWEDELLMRVLTHDSTIIGARAVKGIGMEEIKAAIEECENAGCWWEAALLWFAATTQSASTSGKELIRASSAISHVPETTESKALESKILTMLLYVGEGVCSHIYASLMTLVSIVSFA